MTAVNLVWGPAAYGQWGVGALLVKINLDDSNDKLAMAMALPKDGVIDRVGCCIATINGAPPDYQVSVETLDGAGLPSGADYGGSAAGSWSPGGVGWVWVALGTNATANAGDIIAAVIGPTGVAPDGVDNIEVVRFPIVTSTGLPREYYYSASWGTGAYHVPVAVRYTDGEVVGVAASSCQGEAFDSADTPDEMGCKFTVPADMTCYGARLGFNDTEADTSYEILLYNDADAVIGQATIADGDHARGGSIGGRLVSVYWDAVALTADAVYRLTVRATHATALVQPARITFPDVDSRNWMPEGSRWTGTERTDQGAWTDIALEQHYMGLLISDITLAAAAGGTLIRGSGAINP